MNLQETLELIKALKMHGVTKFKSLEHDIVLDVQAASNIIEAELKPIRVHDVPQAPPIVPPPTPEQLAKEKEAEEKLKDMIKTLNMTPDEMAKKMFPEV